MAQQLLVGQGLLRGFMVTLGLWMNDQPDAETST